MSAEQIRKKKAEVVARFGEWTAHNVHLGEGVYTLGEFMHGDEPLLRRILQIGADALAKPLPEARVLDLACLEGMYATEFARHGASALGIEVREANIEKARFVREVLALDNLEFAQDDVRNLSAEKYGLFDIVLCLGILYHLDAPDIFEFVHKMAEVCTRCLILDTHVSPINEASFVHGGKEYWGSYFTEHGQAATPEEKEKLLWASIDNPKSVWLTRPSLFNLLAHAGFTTVYECYTPAMERIVAARHTFLAIKGRPQEVLSSPLESASPPREWPPQEAEPLGAGGHASVLRRLGSRLPVPVKNAVKKVLR